MSRKLIPVQETTRAWSEDPAYRAAYDALEGEFALASATIEGHAATCVSQQRTAGASAPTTRPRRS